MTRSVEILAVAGALLWAMVKFVLGQAMANELSELCPFLADKLVRWTARHLPCQQERYEEEWLNVLAETPGKLTKLARAMCFMLTLPAMRRALRGPRRRRNTSLWQRRLRARSLGRSPLTPASAGGLVWSGAVVRPVAILLSIALLLGWLSTRPSGSPASTGPSTANRPSEHPASTRPSYAAVPTLPQKGFLSDLESVSQSLDMTSDAAQLAGRTYMHSLVYKCTAFCNEPQGVIEYNLGRHYKVFTATVGVDDRVGDTTQATVFEVYIDGRRTHSDLVAFGHPKRIAIDVSAGLRLQLLASIGDVETPLQAGANVAGGVPNHLPHVAWGDAQVSA